MYVVTMNTQEIISVCAEKCFQNMFDSTKAYLTQRLDVILANKEIQQNNFETWLNSKADRFKAARKPVSMFLTVLEDDLEKGNLPSVTKIPAKPQDLDDKAARLEDLESFEKEVDDWIRMFEETKLFGAPLSRGIDKYNNIRGVFDGLGSFVYTDGTVSKKYPRLEDLSKEDRDALIVRIDVRHRGLPGHDEIVALVKGV